MNRQIAILSLLIAFPLIITSTVQAEPNLAAHWKLDETDGNTAYDSAGSNDGNVIGAVWTSGLLDGALSFDGADDYVGCGTGPAIIGTVPFTASAWIKTDAAKGQAIVVQRSTSSGNGSYGMSVLSDGTVQFHIYNGGYGLLLQSEVTVNNGLWHHIAMVRTNSTDGEIYIDGSLAASGSGPAKSLNNVPVWIGRGFTGPFYFQGKIDDVRIYDKALSAQEVLVLYAAALDKPAIRFSPVQFEFTAAAGGANPADQVLSIYNIGPNTLNWQISEDCGWLTAEPNTGSSTGETDDVNLSVDITGLAWGNYNCQLTISDPCAENSPQTVNVNLTINGPVIAFSPTEFEFYAVSGGANPPSQVLSISNSGASTLNWEITEDCGWLTAEPNSGSSTGEADDANLSVDITGLTGSSYNCNLTVSDPLAENNPQIVTITLHIMNANWPISLKYDAEANSYAHTSVRVGISGSDTAQDFSSDGMAWSRAHAYAFVEEGCGSPFSDRFYNYDSYTAVGVYGAHNLNGAWLVSNLKGWGRWMWYDGCLGDGYAGTGSGDGNGIGSIFGGIGIGLCEGYPEEPIDLILKLDAEVTGDAPVSWQSWDWWLKIWDSDYNNPLVIMNDSNLSADLDVLAGEALNFEFYHEAQKDYWPEAGLDSTVEIDLFVSSIADFDEDGDISLPDFAILASQWLQVPGIPSADIEPAGGDDIVDWNDLGLLVKYWLCGCYPKGLIANWKFDEGSGTDANDSVGTNHGILHGDPNWVAGQIGNYALEFDGSGDYINCSNDYSLDCTDAITIAAWVKRPNFDTSGVIAGKTNGGSVTAGYGLFSYVNGLEFNFYSGDWRRTTPRVAIPANEWHHVAATYDGDVAYLYVDGEQKASVAYTGTITAATGYPFHISYWRASLPAYLQGTIDDMRIYDKALSAGEIQQLYQAGLP